MCSVLCLARPGRLVCWILSALCLVMNRSLPSVLLWSGSVRQRTSRRSCFKATAAGLWAARKGCERYDLDLLALENHSLIIELHQCVIWGYHEQRDWWGINIKNVYLREILVKAPATEGRALAGKAWQSFSPMIVIRAVDLTRTTAQILSVPDLHNISGTSSNFTIY